jgi:galactokinase/mevalonate kinase-like predicted kinase
MKTEDYLHQSLVSAQNRRELPAVIAYHRIDGPGSSLDLPEFQEAFWRIPVVPKDFEIDPSLAWSDGLPRTVGITINSGTRASAHPYFTDRIAVASVDYQFEVSAKPGEVLPTKDNWLLKIMEIFGLSGVKFVLKNISSNTCSSGLGGSATATTCVCILANELTGRQFRQSQLVSLASRIEQSYGVSITGAQEQSNVMYGGVTDYLWLPWGMPRPTRSFEEDTGFGTSLRWRLMPNDQYDQLESRLCIFHSGRTRSSTDVNAVWLKARFTTEGYGLLRRMPKLAYQFREGLRLRDWQAIAKSINDYRTIRSELCPEYMTGAGEMQRIAETLGCATFPLGAGGGGAALIFGQQPDSVQAVRSELAARDYLEIPFRIRDEGHECFNLGRVTQGWSSRETNDKLQTIIANDRSVYA